MKDNIREVRNLKSDSVITLTVNDSTDDYTPFKDVDGSWDLRAVADVNTIYGLSCETMKEMRSLLVEDCKSGIISFAAIKLMC